MFLGRGVAEHRAAIPADHRRADAAGDVVVARRDVGGDLKLIEAVLSPQNLDRECRRSLFPAHERLRLIQYFLRSPFSQARMIQVTDAGKVIYKTGAEAQAREGPGEGRSRPALRWAVRSRGRCVLGDRRHSLPEPV